MALQVLCRTEPKPRMTAAFPETGRLAARLAAWAELADGFLAPTWTRCPVSRRRRRRSLVVGSFSAETNCLAARPPAWAELADGSLAPARMRCPVSRRRRRRKQQKKLKITQIHAIISDNPTIFTAKYAKSQKKINYRLFGSSFSVKKKKISSNCSLRRKSTAPRDRHPPRRSTAPGDRRSSAGDPQPTTRSQSAGTQHPTASPNPSEAHDSPGEGGQTPQPPPDPSEWRTNSLQVQNRGAGDLLQNSL